MSGGIVLAIFCQYFPKRLSGQDVQMPGALTVMRFRDYLAEHYKREDEIASGAAHS